MSGWFAYNTLVVLGGVSLLAAACGTVGAFAVLRKRALIGDALAHASYPGVCLAFMLTGERRLSVLLAGALTAGLLGIGCIAALRRYTRLKEDAAIGAVLSVFFGAGVVLSRMIQNDYAGGAKAGLDSFILGKTAGMTRGDLQFIAVVAGVSVACVILLYKEFKLTSFDTGFAAALGWPVARLDLALMSLIATAVMIGLPAVGVVMIAALLIIPGACARFWTNRLGVMLILSGGIGLAVGLIGTLISASYSVLPAGPVIVLTGTAFFIVSLLAGSQHGLIAQWFERRRFNRQWRLRRLLQLMFQQEEHRSNKPQSIPALVRRLAPTRAAGLEILDEAKRMGYVKQTAARRVVFTDLGRRRALEVTRGRRLWEACLVADPELATSVADLGEESIDRLVSHETVERLTSQLKAEGRWPELT